MTGLHALTDLQTQALDLLPVAALLLADDGSIVFANDTFCRAVGLLSDAVEGVLLAALFTPSGEHDVAQLLAAASGGGTVVRAGHLLTLAGRVPVTTSLTALAATDAIDLDEERPPVGALAAFVPAEELPPASPDLIERGAVPSAGVGATRRSPPEDDTADTRRQAQALSDAQLLARFDRSAVAQALVDDSGALRSVNDAFSRLLGRPAGELLGLPLALLPRSAAADTAQEVMDRVLAGDQDACQVELLLEDASGQELPLVADLTCVRGTGGASAGGALFLHDMTALRASEQRGAQAELFATMSRVAGDLVLIGDAASRLVYVSPSVRRVLGYDADAVAGLTGWDFVHPDDLVVSRAVYEAVVQDGLTRTMVLRILTSDGQWRWIEETAVNMLDDAAGGIVCNLRDIHEQTLLQQELQKSEATFRAIAEAGEEGIWALDASGSTVFANRRMAQMLGRPLHELYDLPAWSLLAADEQVLMAERRRLRHTRGPERYELRHHHPELGERVFLVSPAVLPAPDPSGIETLAIVSDVTDNRQAARELERLALHDPLTGLANRALLLDRLEQSLARTDARSAVLLIDLDHFKLVNDSRGHSAGDDLLVAVARALVEVVRPQDTVARLGGDEFVVLAEGLTQAQAVALGQGALTALSTVVDVDGRPSPVNASAGLAMGPGSASDLMRFADTAMYAAKADGRGRVRAFDPALAREVEDRYALSRDLREAFRTGSLSMALQPIVDLATGGVVGVESLVRWTHPTRGPVPAGRLVAVAELTGLAYSLDSWAVSRALRDVGAMQREGTLPAGAYVAVNLTALNLADQGLEDLLVSATAATGRDPTRVVLEITESAIMVDAGAASRLLHRLRARGYQIAIDDFGTGHSSLAYLRDLPVTSLKIDRTFVSGMTEDDDALAIVASIIDLARRVGLSTVAEGVETEQQAALLRGLGCTCAQGWLWSVAMSPAEVAAHGGWAAPFDVPDAADAAAVLPPPSQVGTQHGLHLLLALHEQGASLTTIAAALNRDGYRRPEGQRWHRVSVARVLADAARAAASSSREQRHD